MNVNKYKRAGVIPYIKMKVNNEYRLYFLFGIDKKTKDLTDFGGGLKINKETPYEGALREFNEETCGIFSNEIHINNIKKSPYIYYNNSIIFFVNLDSKWLINANIYFKKKHKKFINIKNYDEIDRLYWIEKNIVKKIIYYDIKFKTCRMWEKLRTNIKYNWSNIIKLLY